MGQLIFKPDRNIRVCQKKGPLLPEQVPLKCTSLDLCLDLFKALAGFQSNSCLYFRENRMSCNITILSWGLQTICGYLATPQLKIKTAKNFRFLGQASVRKEKGRLTSFLTLRISLIRYLFPFNCDKKLCKTHALISRKSKQHSTQKMWTLLVFALLFAVAKVWQPHASQVLREKQPCQCER